jgi:hypothetical protein
MWGHIHINITENERPHQRQTAPYKDKPSEAKAYPYRGRKKNHVEAPAKRSGGLRGPSANDRAGPKRPPEEIL